MESQPGLFSSTDDRDSSGRKLLDRYYTPTLLAESLVGLLPIGETDKVLEPHVGGGAFAAAVLRRTPHVVVRDIDPDAHGLTLVPDSKVADFLLSPPPEAAFDWVIGNPPYVGAVDHIEQAIRCAKPGGGIAFLLRLGLLGSTGRVPFWREFPCRQVSVIPFRPSFDGKRNGKYDYGWFWWQRGWTGKTTLVVLPA